MSRCSGWLLTFADGAQAVIGQRELIHLVHPPRTHEVPCAPPYCRHALAWEEDILPVFDVGRWANPDAPDIPDPSIAVVGFLPAEDSRQADHGGLLLASSPRLIDVDDAWACDLPAELQHWRPITCACFERDRGPLPILDLRRLFTADLG